MTHPWKRRRPERPTQKQIRAAFDAQAPFDSAVELPKKTRRKWHEDGLGGTDLAKDETTE